VWPAGLGVTGRAPAGKACMLGLSAQSRRSDTIDPGMDGRGNRAAERVTVTGRPRLAALGSEPAPSRASLGLAAQRPGGTRTAGRTAERRLQGRAPAGRQGRRMATRPAPEGRARVGGLWRRSGAGAAPSRGDEAAVGNGRSVVVAPRPAPHEPVGIGLVSRHQGGESGAAKLGSGRSHSGGGAVERGADGRPGG
jgi:hypothetical protein